MKRVFLILMCALMLAGCAEGQTAVVVNGTYLPVTWDAPTTTIPEGAALSYELFTAPYPGRATLTSAGTTLAIDYSIPMTTIGVRLDIGVQAVLTYADGHVERSDMLWASEGGVDVNKQPWPWVAVRYIKPDRVKALRVKS
jgi:hypothetical protein